MEYYICDRCGKVVDELPEEKNSHYTMSGEYLGTERLVNLDCDCGGTFEEATECQICGEAIKKDGNPLCEDCVDYFSTTENALEMGQDEMTEISINGFLASVFKDSEIYEILLKEFENMPENLKKKYAKDYCNEDSWHFAYWLEEKHKNVNIY